MELLTGYVIRKKVAFHYIPYLGRYKCLQYKALETK
jgi:hypothetical protein